MSDDELKAMFGELRQDLREETAAIRQEMRTETAAIRQEMRTETAAIRQEMREETAAIRQETVAMREENAAMHVETRRHFDVSLEAARHEIGLVAEGLADTRESLARHVGELHEKIDRTARETQAMYKFSHAELDRRVTALEKAQSKPN